MTCRARAFPVLSRATRVIHRSGVLRSHESATLSLMEVSCALNASSSPAGRKPVIAQRLSKIDAGLLIELVCNLDGRTTSSSAARSPPILRRRSAWWRRVSPKSAPLRLLRFGRSSSRDGSRMAENSHPGDVAARDLRSRQGLCSGDACSTTWLARQKPLSFKGHHARRIVPGSL